MRYGTSGLMGSALDLARIEKSGVEHGGRYSRFFFFKVCQTDCAGATREGQTSYLREVATLLAALSYRNRS